MRNCLADFGVLGFDFLEDFIVVLSVEGVFSVEEFIDNDSIGPDIAG